MLRDRLVEVLASKSGAMMALLIWSPMSLVPLSAAMSAKLAPAEMVMGAEGWPAYLPEMYVRKKKTST